ncbi:1,4-dihydroxy-2-naphthoate polyprenyltransferase [Oenococcus sicerae]|uniref:1,4-dihydroxy-2-naphthoate polyprenyltransferase n=1 Tax=Oenococcus sicerae TaxID=2203724 RepID=A0ABX5QNV4_9LACO|nr:1,4-dihydroxy-2-naphthoate polyprenyltransferase [Oenococcus sicerae]QAS70471.1 1,4-dihydroxy-2-naphthoate polyprenyltransferase [Oenococcus sicerae]
MNFKIFSELVELKAKTASIFPFLLGLLYSFYHFQQVNLINSAVFFVAMLLFNMAVDANDNYQDYKRAMANEAEHFRLKTNVIGVHHLNMKKIFYLICLLMLTSMLLGLWLVLQTSLLLLPLGVFCFAVGYFYAAGPRPISATPFGEFFSGFTMGYMIFLINVYLNIFPEKMTWMIALQAFLPAGLLSFSIAALLLANNICDEKEDISLKRQTIVHYLGKRRSLVLFDLFYVIGAAAYLLSITLGLLPKAALLAFLVTPIIWKNILKFNQKQVKKEDFILAVKNLLIISLAQTVAVAIGVWLKF